MSRITHLLSTRWVRTIFVAALAVVGTAVSAQAWPNKPVRLVVSYPPGGLADVMARLLQQPLTESLGQPVIIENRGGAAGNLVADYVAKSKDVGHIMMTAGSAMLAANPSPYSKLSYSAEMDFAPVGLIARSPLVLVVPPKVTANNLMEFLAWAKHNHCINYASPGAGSLQHLMAELFRQQTDLNLTYLPYRGAAPALQLII